MSHEKSYINAFNLISGIGPQKLYILAQAFPHFSDAWHAEKSELLTAGISEKLAETIISARKEIDPDYEWQRCVDAEIDLISIREHDFPKQLKNISNPPFFLYYRGNREALSIPSVTVVGSRKISDYAKHATEQITASISDAGVTIISGLALGTDAVAHHSALKSSGVTIAVLGGGIDNATITPRSHTSLAKNILASNGTLISEYPIGTEPNRGTFPARNRLMAGLANATVIIEAAEKSGTLITAERAHEYDRPIFALPGSIFSQNTHGPHTLIRDRHAALLTSAQDILSLFHKEQSKNIPEPAFSNDMQKNIYKIIADHSNGIQINALIKESSIDGSVIASELTLMEIDGVIKNIGNQIYQIHQN